MESRRRARAGPRSGWPSPLRDVSCRARRGRSRTPGRPAPLRASPPLPVSRRPRAEPVRRSDEERARQLWEARRWFLLARTADIGEHDVPGIAFDFVLGEGHVGNPRCFQGVCACPSSEKTGPVLAFPWVRGRRTRYYLDRRTRLREAHLCKFVSALKSPMIAPSRPRPSSCFALARSADLAAPDRLRTLPDLPIREYRDAFGNLCAT